VELNERSTVVFWHQGAAPCGGKVSGPVGGAISYINIMPANKTMISQESPTPVAIVKNADDVEILLACLRDVSYPVRNFTDAMLKRKIGDRLPHVAAEFNAFIQQDRILMKNQKLAEGVRLLKLLTEQMKKSDMPVSVMTICNCMGWLESVLQREYDARKSEWVLVANSPLTT
jgi:hypothetical protein